MTGPGDRPRQPTPAGVRTRIVVADDHTLFRQGLVELMSSETDFEVVAEAASGSEAIETVGRYRPDILLLDVEMPGPGAKAVVRELSRRFPETQIAILTMHDDAGMLGKLIDCGAVAYLLKSIARIELVGALHALRRQSDNVQLSVSKDTIDQLNHPPEPVLLSDREQEVLRLTSQALTNSQIAGRLFIAEATVKRHLTNIFAKLGAVSRMDAIRKASLAGLLDGDVGPEGTQADPTAWAEDGPL